MNFYIVDFAKRMAKKSKVPVLIYLGLNVFVIATIIGIAFELNFAQSIASSILLYGVSLAIALSPIGEFILRLQTGCKKIKRVDQLNKIQPLFNEVYERARSLDPSIPENIKLYMSDDEEPNAFATGRKTICVTEGMLYLSDAHIKATLAHEFGHLAHKDTDLILMVCVGNLIVNTCILALRIFIDVMYFIFSMASVIAGGREGALGAGIAGLYRLLITLVISGLMWIWSKIGILLVMKSSRSNEYEADEFSFKLGYGDDLCALLEVIGGSRKKGLFANLASSHPDKDSRIERLQSLGANYYKDYYVG